MTMMERGDIFSKEVLSIADIEKLYEVSYKQASELLLEMKKKLTGNGKELRVAIQGKIHTQDYLDWVGVTADRYSIKKGDEQWEKASQVV